MRADDEYLSAFSFHDAAPLRAPPKARRPKSPSPIRGRSSSTPTLYSMTSDADFAVPPYPSEFYNPSTAPAAAPPSHLDAWTASSYGYEAWKSHAFHRKREEGATLAEVNAAVSAAEKQRQVLKMEMDLAEEQRRRLEARMSSSRLNSVQPTNPQGATVAPEVGRTGTESSTRALAEGGDGMIEETGEAGETATCDAAPVRDFSEEAPPPFSPSPPSAHASTNAALFLDEDAERKATTSFTPPQAAHANFTGVLGMKRYAANEVAGVGDAPLRDRTPSPSPSRVAAQVARPSVVERAESERCSRRSPSSQRTSMLRSPEPPQQQRHPSKKFGPAHIPSCARESSSDSAASPPRDSSAALKEGYSNGCMDELSEGHEGEQEEEERLYAAYQRKLARIQEALRMSSLCSTAEGFASAEAQLAHHQRQRLCTPALRAPCRRFVEDLSGVTAHLRETMPMEVSSHTLVMTSPSHRGAQEMSYTGGLPPLVRRAPSLGSASVTPLPGRPPRQLRWDPAHSGNIVVSSDGFVCRTDATDAIRIIEDEYADRLMEVLPRLMIPFYAVGNLGTTYGSLCFSFRWISPNTGKAGGRRPVATPTSTSKSASTMSSRVPALAFGFATHAFTGYGTEAPAFLYLSTGKIAQGLCSTGASGAAADRSYGAAYGPGLELAARLDMRRGELEFFVESVSMGVAFRFCPARHPAPLFPVVVFSSENDVVELLYSA
ncbi:hypothetical protein ABL78_1599 [Leptomonas seymouri]|uniref:B30.2/SPRY domain-containing protein n=1 Tax=Leptomonas seymouri TaxID=5684 RepID=A0A0N0P7X1_LEPSE|nr:hypothetical protein ABL78_1599 [Leptomonas seymouri]|eukprot:KPI89266.1 hypothetical protein ABL78_1599 [Leptomonas seymouri]